MQKSDLKLETLHLAEFGTRWVLFNRTLTSVAIRNALNHLREHTSSIVISIAFGSANTERVKSSLGAHARWKIYYGSSDPVKFSTLNVCSSELMAIVLFNAFLYSATITICDTAGSAMHQGWLIDIILLLLYLLFV